MLSKREKNELYEAIVAEGLDPAEFSIEDKFFRVVITHDSGSTYKILQGKQGFQVIVHVEDGIDAVVDELNVEEMIKYSFLHWLTEIRATVGAPDYWAEALRSQESIAVLRHQGFENTPFTEDEQRQIAAQLLEIQIKLDQFELPGDQMAELSEKLDVLVEASRHAGRKDWLIIFITTISPLVVSDIMTPGLTRHTFTMVINRLIHLFGGASPHGL